MATGLYPALGLELPLASSNAQEPVWASMRTATYAIPSGSYSIGVPLNAGITTSFNVVYGTAPSGTAFEVRYDYQPSQATEYVLDSVASVASRKVYTWSTSSLIELDGFVRIKNTGSQDCVVYVQQRATFKG